MVRQSLQLERDAADELGIRRGVDPGQGFYCVAVAASTPGSIAVTVLPAEDVPGRRPVPLQSGRSRTKVG